MVRSKECVNIKECTKEEIDSVLKWLSIHDFINDTQ